MKNRDKTTQNNWFSRLKAGLGQTSASFGAGITSIFSHGRLDQEALESLEEVLILGDMGSRMATELVSKLSRERFGQNVTEKEVRLALSREITSTLEPVAKPLSIKYDAKPHVILVAGVNGTGKTTTVGKLASQYRTEGLNVILAAADTFRAAATEQLRVWGDRSGCPVVALDKLGGDPAGLAFEALKKAKTEKADILLIDTAGRLQNKANLMAELQKISRVLKKIDEEAPHTTILVLDATTGQNAHNQVEQFCEAIDINGLIITKFDGSAKAGVLVALAERFALPVFALGVGEDIEDLKPFEPKQFAQALMNINA